MSFKRYHYTIHRWFIELWRILTIPRYYKKQCFSNDVNKNYVTNFLCSRNQEEKFHLEKLCRALSDIFLQDKNELTFTNKVKHRIRTTEEVSVYTKTNIYPFIHKRDVEKQINEMLARGIIGPSKSPWSFPIWSVWKKHLSRR